MGLILPWWSKYAAVAALAVALWLHGWTTGRGQVRDAWDQANAEREAAYMAEVVRLAQVRERVIYQYIDRYRVVAEKAATIVKEVPRYVTVQADSACTVPVGAVRVHDAAAGNEPLSEPPGSADERASGIALSTLVGTTAENYGRCWQIREQLKALQEWARTR